MKTKTVFNLCVNFSCFDAINNLEMIVKYKYALKYTDLTFGFANISFKLQSLTFQFDYSDFFNISKVHVLCDQYVFESHLNSLISSFYRAQKHIYYTCFIIQGQIFLPTNCATKCLKFKLIKLTDATLATHCSHWNYRFILPKAIIFVSTSLI